MVLEFSKSILIDAVLHRYRKSLISAGLFSASIEIKMHQMLEQDDDSRQIACNLVDERPIEEETKPAIHELRAICQTWERVVGKVFNKEALTHVDKFGHYIILR